MLSIPSKLMESCVASNITNHVVTQNLLDSRQWAYRKGKSTKQLLIHLTERWREAVERKLFVGILFVDFTKAFDTVSHNILLQKLNDLGIRISSCGKRTTLQNEDSSSESTDPTPIHIL